MMCGSGLSFGARIGSRTLREVYPGVGCASFLGLRLGKQIAMVAFAWALALATGGCGGAGCWAPSVAPAQIGTVSQDAQSWYILYSAGTGDHPMSPPTEWAMRLPSAGGLLNNVQTPFRTVARPQKVVMTFQVTASPDAVPVSTVAAASPCRDHDPCTPVAEFHVFFEVQGDDGSETGRWWYKPGFRLTNVANDSYDAEEFVADGQPHKVTISLTADQWTSVTGRGTASDFESALKNVGYVGVTFGGSDYFAMGVEVEQGTVDFQMIDYQVE